MFPTLPESTPELEACAQLKNLHTRFLPMCKLPTLPHSTYLFDKNPADDGFPPLKDIRSRTIRYLNSHTSASANQDLKGNHRVYTFWTCFHGARTCPSVAMKQHLFTPAGQPAQTQRYVSTFSICSAWALVRAELIGGFSVLHTQSPSFQGHLKSHSAPSLSIRVPRFDTEFLLTLMRLVVVFKELYC